ncbi:uncharacterized protein LY89DRAFT_374431 [Mollisia scopiformis]|uniref:Uncharacterized protein n=1 Tax=Mollisia scopiformis TaxID=149040 RepID=A0A132B4R3_MOLSC|nr:uncharacterized protein LY89DRAFT_374431 [Mollisia scopiformis]KUJ06979.1 hypothetical protein LY89DRAFT_374431 [Mollisia scopiformis]
MLLFFPAAIMQHSDLLAAPQPKLDLNLRCLRLLHCHGIPGSSGSKLEEKFREGYLEGPNILRKWNPSFNVIA